MESVSVQEAKNQKSRMKTSRVRAGYLFMSTLSRKRKEKLILLSEPMVRYEALSSTLLCSRMVLCTRYSRRNIMADIRISTSRSALCLVERHSGEEAFASDASWGGEGALWPSTSVSGLHQYVTTGWMAQTSSSREMPRTRCLVIAMRQSS
ncbi:hypothetical protein AALO_G00175230 [Alosa alosa]|uniref:Uncharacterized protein n=1 Tax=Alosa alosa TaxID=278164 RepID=A0AAV6G8X0_9TELE|nr:hypothetical protein AALO_G00175230 [Alosa alosa]